MQIYTRGAKIHQVKMLRMNTALDISLTNFVFASACIHDIRNGRSWVTTSGIPERVTNASE